MAQITTPIDIPPNSEVTSSGLNDGIIDPLNDIIGRSPGSVGIEFEDTLRARRYDTVSDLPTRSEGNLAYVLETHKYYAQNGTEWEVIGTGSGGGGSVAIASTEVFNGNVTLTGRNATDTGWTIPAGVWLLINVDTEASPGGQPGQNPSGDWHWVLSDEILSRPARTAGQNLPSRDKHLMVGNPTAQTGVAFIQIARTATNTLLVANEVSVGAVMPLRIRTVNATASSTSPAQLNFDADFFEGDGQASTPISIKDEAIGRDQIKNESITSQHIADAGLDDIRIFNDNLITEPKLATALRNKLNESHFVAQDAAPSTPSANDIWLDTVNDVWKIRNNTNDAWVEISGEDVTDGKYVFGDGDDNSPITIIKALKDVADIVDDNTGWQNSTDIFVSNASSATRYDAAAIVNLAYTQSYTIGSTDTGENKWIAVRIPLAKIDTDTNIPTKSTRAVVEYDDDGEQIGEQDPLSAGNYITKDASFAYYTVQFPNLPFAETLRAQEYDDLTFPAKNISTDTTNFDGNLASDSTNVQLALEKFDDFTVNTDGTYVHGNGVTSDITLGKTGQDLINIVNDNTGWQNSTDIFVSNSSSTSAYSLSAIAGLTYTQRYTIGTDADGENRWIAIRVPSAKTGSNSVTDLQHVRAVVEYSDDGEHVGESVIPLDANIVDVRSDFTYYTVQIGNLPFAETLRAQEYSALTIPDANVSTSGHTGHLSGADTVQEALTAIDDADFVISDVYQRIVRITTAAYNALEAAGNVNENYLYIEI